MSRLKMAGMPLFIMAGMVLISVRVSLEVWTKRHTVKKKNFQKVKEKNNNNKKKKINKIAHYCNVPRISFFKRCVKENVVAAVFMLELILFQIFCPRTDILFCPLTFLQIGISNAICDLVYSYSYINIFR